MVSEDRDLTSKTDVLVIGGGVVGIFVAYFLAGHGVRVTVVDKDAVGSGASRANAGLIVTSYTLPLAAPGVMRQAIRWLVDSRGPLHIKPRFDGALASWLWRFAAACREDTVRRVATTVGNMARRSLEVYRELAQRETSLAFHQKGWVMLCNTDAGLEKTLHEATLLAQFGVRSESLDLAGIQAKLPTTLPSIVGGVYYPDDGHVTSERFVDEIARLAVSRGVQLCTSTEVLDFNMSGSRIAAVVTTGGTFSADHIVLAAGSWSAPLGRKLHLGLPVEPAKGYTVTMSPAAGPLPFPCYLSEKKVTMTPVGEAIRMAGVFDLAGFDCSIDLRRTSAIAEAGRFYFARWQAPESRRLWCGFRPATPDSLPIIGRSRNVDNLVFATGHGMMGMTLAAATGELVTQIICKQPPAMEARSVSPSRFSL